MLLMIAVSCFWVCLMFDCCGVVVCCLVLFCGLMDFACLFYLNCTCAFVVLASIDLRFVSILAICFGLVIALGLDGFYFLICV